MRRIAPTLTLALVLLLPGASRAEFFSPDANVALSLEFPTLGWTAAGNLNATVVIAGTAPGTRDLVTLLVGGFSATIPQTSTVTSGTNVTFSVPAASNASGTFLASGSGFLGYMPVLGELRVCLFGGGAGCPGLSQGTVFLGVIGAGAPVTSTFALFGLPATLKGNSWTTGVATVTYVATTETRTTSAVAIATGSRMGPGGQASTVAQTGGTLQLVSPFKLSTSLFGDIPGFARFSVSFTGGFPTTTTTTTTSSTSATTTTTTTSSTSPTTTTTTTTTTSTTTTTLAGSRIAVCHVSEEDGTAKTVRAAPSAIAAHLAHGDSLGACVP